MSGAYMMVDHEGENIHAGRGRGSTIITSALPLIADMLGGGVRGLLMTLCGHSVTDTA